MGTCGCDMVAPLASRRTCIMGVTSPRPITRQEITGSRSLKKPGKWSALATQSDAVERRRRCSPTRRRPLDVDGVAFAWWVKLLIPRLPIPPEQGAAERLACQATLVLITRTGSEESYRWPFRCWPCFFYHSPNRNARHAIREVSLRVFVMESLETRTLIVPGPPLWGALPTYAPSYQN